MRRLLALFAMMLLMFLAVPIVHAGTSSESNLIKKEMTQMDLVFAVDDSVIQVGYLVKVRSIVDTKIMKISRFKHLSSCKNKRWCADRQQALSKTSIAKSDWTKALFKRRQTFPKSDE